MGLLNYAQYCSGKVEPLQAGDAIIVETILNVLVWVDEEDITLDHKAIIAGTGAVSLGIGFDDGGRSCSVFPFPESSDFIPL